MYPVFISIVAFSLAALWLIAGWHKATAFDVFSATLGDYRLVPRALLTLVAGLVVAFEFILAAGLIIPVTSSLAMFGSAALLTLYAFAMGLNLLRGRRHIDCGCMGPAARQSLSVWLVVRNLILALAALAAAGGPVTARSLLWLDIVTIGAGVAGFALIYSAINHLIANAPGLAELRH